jgi:large subunit ribosomal protein L7/L12
MTKEEILEAIEKMTVLELSQLVKMIEEKFDVSAAAPVMMGGMMAAAAPAEEKEQTEFDVIITEAGQQKVQVIKAVKEVSGLGLSEAKALVDAAPKPVKTKVSKDEAEEIKGKLVAVGATVEIK